MSTILLTGGRALATLELARLLHLAGHRVLVAESVHHHLCRSSRAVAACFRVPPPRQARRAFLAALMRIVEREQVDLLVPTCEEVFHVAHGLERFTDHCAVLAPELPVLRRLHGKFEFIEWAAQLGFAVPRTELLTTPAAMVDAVARLPAGERLVLKPVYSRFGTQVRVVGRGDTPLPVEQVSPRDPWVAQEFVAGTQICTYGIARGGRLVVHAAYERDFVVGTGTCISFRACLDPAILRWVRRFVESTEVEGQVAFDMIRTPVGPVPIECNPRLTSGIHLLANVPGVAAAILGERPVDAPVLQPPPDACAMLALPMLVWGLPGAVRERRLRHWSRTWRRSRDTAFRWDDPYPFFRQFALLAALLRTARREEVGLIEASTHDIEWNGGIGSPVPIAVATPQPA